MTFNVPLLGELKQSFESEFLVIAKGRKARLTFGKAIASMIAGATHILFSFIRWQRDQYYITKCERESLLEWGRTYTFPIKPADYAKGKIRLTGKKGTFIPSETELVFLPTGIRYETDQDVTIEDEYADVDIIAIDSGRESNLLQTGVQLSLTKVIAGADPTALSISLISGGTDEEKLEDYRNRLLQYLAESSQTGTIADIRGWARSVPGVVEAWVKREWRSANGIAIAFRVESGGLFVDPAIQDKVLQFVAGKAAAETIFYAFEVRKKQMDFVIGVRSTDADIEEKIRSELFDICYFRFAPAGFYSDNFSQNPSSFRTQTILEYLRLLPGIELITIDAPQSGVEIPLEFGEIPWPQTIQIRRL